MHRRSPFPWFGILLVVVGTVLLLDRLFILDFGISRILWTSVIVVGLFLTVQGFQGRRSSGIFWGTVIFLYGIYFLVRTFEPFQTHLFLPVSITIIGIALLMIYFNSPSEWFLLIPGISLSAVGILLLLAWIGLYDVEEFWRPIRTFWPIVLILAGFALLVGGRLKRHTM